MPKFTFSSGTGTTNTWVTMIGTTEIKLTPFEHNVLLQWAGYGLGIPWDGACMHAINSLLNRGYMSGQRGSPYPRDYAVTTLGRNALNLRIEDAR